MTSTTSSVASSLAAGCSIGTSASSTAMRAETRAPPKVPIRMLTSVMPTCTVGRKVCGSADSFSAAVAPAVPFRSSTISRARRTETIAISLRANRPLMRINSRMIAISKPGPMPHNTACRADSEAAGAARGIARRALAEAS